MLLSDAHVHSMTHVLLFVSAKQSISAETLFCNTNKTIDAMWTNSDYYASQHDKLADIWLF